MKTRVILLSAVLLCLIGCRSQMASRSGSIAYPQATARILEESARRTTSVEGFGESITRKILRDAASQIRVGNQNPVNVDLSFTVTITELPFPIPQPEPFPHPELPTKEELMNLNICAIICSGDRDCYVDCTFPGLDLHPFHLRDCDDILEDLKNCDDDDIDCLVRYVLELVQQECVSVED